MPKNNQPMPLWVKKAVTKGQSLKSDDQSAAAKKPVKQTMDDFEAAKWTLFCNTQ